MRLISYCNKDMDISAYKLVESANLTYKFFKSWKVYTEKEFNTELINSTTRDELFYLSNHEVLNKERGAGYWLWKPYIILKELLQMADNSLLMYSDAGIELVRNPDIITDKMQEDIFLFGNNYKHVEWCKADCMMAINGQMLDANLLQAQASVIFIRNNETTRNFVKEWLLWCQMPGFIDDSPSKLPNYPTFAEHRHDQAILTCLAYKHGYKLHYWPAEYNNGAFKYDKLPQYRNDNYPIIFHHHRRRNDQW